MSHSTRYLEDCGGLECEDMSGLSMLEVLRSSLRLYGSIFAAMFVLFLLGRRYQPKAYFVLEGSEEECTELCKQRFGPISWMWKVFRVTDEELFEQCGMDAVCFIRTLGYGMGVAVIATLNGIYLFPIYATSGGEFSELEAVTLGNVPEGSPKLFAATVACYIVYCSVLYLLYREFSWYTTYRHAYLVRQRIDNYSVYVKFIPSHLRSNDALIEYFCSVFDKDAVIDAQLALDISALDKATAERDELCGTDEKVGKFEHAINVLHTTSDPKERRPRHKTLGCCGIGCAKPVDSIDYYSEKLDELNRMVAELIDDIDVGAVNGNTRASSTREQRHSHLLVNDATSDDLQPPLRLEATAPTSTAIGRRDSDRQRRNELSVIPNISSSRVSTDDDSSIASELSGSSMQFGLEAAMRRDKILARDIDALPKIMNMCGTDGGMGTSTRFGTVQSELSTEEIIAVFANEPEIPPTEMPIENREEIGEIVSVETEPKKTSLAKFASMSKVRFGSTRDAGFVSFSSLKDKNSAIQVVQHPTPFTLNVAAAPPPDHIVWSNVGMRHKTQQIGKWVALALTVGLCLFWTVLVAFIASFGEVEKLTEMLPFLESWLEAVPQLSMILAQVKPLLLVIIVGFLSPLLTSFSNREGHISVTSLSASVFYKLSVFLIVQLFFVQMISGAVISELQAIIEDPMSIVPLMAEAIPAQAQSFAQYVIVQTAMSLGSELLRASEVFREWIQAILIRYRPWIGLERRSIVPDLDYTDVQAKLVLYYMILFAYAVMSPVLAIIMGVSFLLFSLCYRHQIIYVYSVKMDSGGQLFIKFVSLTVGCIIISEFVMFGVLALKQGVVAAPLLIPLIVGTFLFKSYINQQHYHITMYLPSVIAAQEDRRKEGKIDWATFAKDAYTQPSRKERFKEPDNINLLKEDPGVPEQIGEV
mmetsp:Transcript_34526/g.74875  ORF Transcript_34526/g.74875 Transcript_34526/m.74875 type:complete len:929 (-) Transcript_34526:73-2859(-)